MMAPKGRVATQPNDQLVHQMVQVRPPNGSSQPVGDGLVHYCISLSEEGGSTLCRPRRSTVQRRLVLVPPHVIRTPIWTQLEPHGIGSLCLKSPCSRSPTPCCHAGWQSWTEGRGQKVEADDGTKADCRLLRGKIPPFVSGKDAENRQHEMRWILWRKCFLTSTNQEVFIVCNDQRYESY